MKIKQDSSFNLGKDWDFQIRDDIINGVCRKAVEIYFKHTEFDASLMFRKGTGNIFICDASDFSGILNINIFSLLNDFIENYSSYFNDPEDDIKIVKRLRKLVEKLEQKVTKAK